jgi:general stress protein YciG
MLRENVGKRKECEMERKEDDKKKTSNRGFASMSPEQQRAIARKGGEAVSRNREHMASIGARGGESVSKNREHMSEIGRKGGEAVSQDREHMKRIGRKGGERGRGSQTKRKRDQGEDTLKEQQNRDRE